MYTILKHLLEAPGIDPGTSRMLSERSTIWATPPDNYFDENKILNHPILNKPYAPNLVDDNDLHAFRTWQ